MQCSCKIRYRDHRNGLGSEDSSPNSSRLGTLSSRELLPERIHDPSGATPLPTPRSEEFAVGPGAQSTGPVALVSGPSSLQSTKPSREAAVVVVSNRLPFTITRTAGGLDRSASSGGLVSALGPVLRDRGGTWVGWPGIDLKPHEVLPLQDESYEIKALYLDEREVTHYVHGFSNRTLWPLMHSLPARTRFDRLDFKIYWEVNERFANAAVAAVSGDDLIWIHDYHLMLAPEFVRQRLPRVRLAFFHHVPFPPLRHLSIVAVGPGTVAQLARLRPGRVSRQGLRGQLPRLCRKTARQPRRSKGNDCRTRQAHGSGWCLPDRNRFRRFRAACQKRCPQVQT